MAENLHAVNGPQNPPSSITFSVRCSAAAPSAPTITSLAPSTGTTAGGETVVITGTGFTGATAVTFGGTAATSFVIDSATQITASTPAHAAGAVDVVVTTPGGSVTETDGFTYEAPVMPQLSISDATVIEGDSGSDLAVFRVTLDRPAPPGGATWTVTFDIATADGSATAGEDYQAASISVGFAPGAADRAFAVEVFGDTSIEADETFVVNVTNVVGATVADGQGVATIVNDDAVPTITGISPATGTTAGGDTVTITGTNLSGAAAVSFGGTTASTFAVASATQMTATTPAHAAGAVDVVVTTPGGTATGPGAFTYEEPASADASLSALAVSAGTLNPAFNSGTTNYRLSALNTTSSITLTPTTTDAAATVTVNGTPVMSGAASEPIALTVGSNTITTIVTAEDGITAQTYTVTVIRDAAAAPTITGIAPTSGTTAGGTSVVITGTDFDGATAVYFGGTATSSFTLDSNTQITAVTPASAAGAVDVVVDTPGGSAILAGSFTYEDDAPIVARDFTVEVPYGTSRVSFSFAEHVDGPNEGFGVEEDDVRALINFQGGTHEQAVPDFSWLFGDEGFVQSGTVRYYTCVEYGLGCTQRGPEAVLTLVVTGAPVAPVVLYVDGPANGTYRAGDVLTFGVAFDQDVIVTGSPSLSLDIGGTARTASLASVNDGFIQAFRYEVQPGDVDSDGIAISSLALNGGTIQNAGGIDVDVTLNNVLDLSGVLVDAVAPTVLSSAVSGSPASGATAVDFTVTFSESVTGVDSADFELTTTGSATGSISGISTTDSIAYDVSVTGISGIGTLRLDVLDNGSIADAVSNSLATAFTSGAPWTRGGSTNADLSALLPSAGTLDPGFDPATISYSVSVANSVDTITFTPTAADARATITVDGQAVTSGSPSQAVALAMGSTAIPVVVTAQDGSTTKTYTLTVTRAASANANLSGLTPSAGTLDPSFDPDSFTYAMAVGYEVETISFTPTAGDPNATITVNGQPVASGTASQAIPLAVGDNTIAVVVTAADGTTTQTYTVVVTRAASSNAELAGLVSSAGTLDPAFDADTFDYAVVVGNTVESLTLTPTAAEPNATITVNGQPVASGSVSPAIALPVGSTSIPVVVTAQDGTTTLTYSVTVERAQPVPVVASRTIEIYAGEMASVELTEGATGSPFTAAEIVDVSDTDAGASRIENDGGSYRLVFESSPTYAGTSSVRYTLSNAAGTSAPGAITFNVLARPDPSQDPEVVGLLTAQVDAAKRFAQVQTRNFNDRLEQLHDEGDRRESSMNVRLGYMEEQDPGERGIQELIGNSHNAVMGDHDDERSPGLLGYGPHGLGGSGALAAVEDLSSPAASDEGGMALGDFAIWSGGFVNFGERDGTIDLDYTNVGVSGGIDYRFSSQFIGGVGVGYSRDKIDVGENGTESSANAYSAAIYGSYKPFENFFLDGLVGGSWLDFDSTRYVTTTGDFATGSRSGHQLFGSLTAAYEFRDETWLVSPYGRVEFSRSWLDGFTEDGGGIFGLRYGDQSVDTLSGVLGVRADYTFVLDWGTLTPGVRVEYTHDFAGSSRVDLGYADLDGLPYAFEIEPTGQSYTTLGLSLDAELPQDWSAGFDYRTSFGSDNQDHAFGLEISKRF